MIKKLGNYAFFSAQQDVHPDVLLLCTNKAHPSQTKMHGEVENFPLHRYDVKKKLGETKPHLPVGICFSVSTNTVL